MPLFNGNHGSPLIKQPNVFSPVVVAGGKPKESKLSKTLPDIGSSPHMSLSFTQPVSNSPKIKQSKIEVCNLIVCLLWG